MAGFATKKRAREKLKGKRLEERKTQQKASGEHDGEVRSAERRLGEGENVPASELNLRVARSIYRKFSHSTPPRKAGPSTATASMPQPKRFSRRNTGPSPRRP
ncbi:hypothetical protein [Bradyrhizobium sp. CCBAU 53380]|uniref:hypothetical protein n=1 Tax=Bradyrhizobium sp. CCBAU 53380 TaxID=1325117 RepID=UPI002303F0C1|nr:hypothetical protein [Bradyrhizobium sp. CCBAU 53380]